MAENDDSAAVRERNLRVDVRRLIFEVRVLLDSVSGGLEMLQRRKEAEPIFEELSVLSKLSAQAAEVVEAFAEIIDPPAADGQP